MNKKEYDKLYYQRNRLKKKEYAQTHRKQINTKNKKWREKNPERFKEMRRRSYNKIKKTQLEMLRARWRENQKSEKAIIRDKNKKHNRRLKYKITDITAKWLNNLFNSTAHCSLCGIKMDNNGSKYPNGKQLDHITPISVGGLHMRNNVRFICMKCNLERPKDGSDILELVEVA